MPTDRASPAADPHRYLALDALRGAAAFAVLFYHFRHIGIARALPAGLPAFASGYLAVDLFFVLSGFVIAHAYGRRLTGDLSFGAFLIVRFVRLQPVIAIGTLIGFALALAQRLLGAEGAPGLFAITSSLGFNLLMLPNPLLPWGMFLFNPPAWSLFYELAANTAYAAAIQVARTRYPGTRLILPALCLAGLAGLVLAVLRAGDLDSGVALADWPVALARIAFSFSLGLLLHRSRQRWLPRLPRVPMPWLLLACLALLAPGFEGWPRALYDLAFAALLSPALVMLAAATHPAPKHEGLAAWLGMISYPLYAVHAPLKHVLETTFPFGFLPLFILGTGSAVLAAWLIGFTVDPALRRWLTARLRPRPPGRAPAPPIAAPAPLSESL
jgi:peptidoglycan/LPS O-acetylase OafA/YrhL